MSTIQKYWRKHALQMAEFKSGYCVIPLVVCKDGFEMSVQASGGHYCAPRDLVRSGAYSHWEVAAGENEPDPLGRYRSHDGIYAMVPTEVIDAIIAEHGGLDSDK